MTNWKQKRALLRVTTLTAALMGVYGAPAMAASDPVSPPITCEPDCSFADETFTYTDDRDTYTWVFQASGEEATLNMDGTTVVARGKKNRAVGAFSGGKAILNGVMITTSGANSHAAHAHGGGSTNPTITLTDATISTQKYESYGLSAQAGGKIVTDGNTRITTNGKAGFGAFAYNSGTLDLNGGSITTNGLAPFDHKTYGDVGNFGVLVKHNSSAAIKGTVITTYGEDAQG